MNQDKKLIIPSLINIYSLYGIFAPILSYLITNYFWPELINFFLNRFGSNIYLFNFLKISLIIYIIILIIFIFYLPFSKCKLPEAVLDSKGIQVKHFGFIEWSEIDELKPYQIYNLPNAQVLIGIKVKDINKLKEQASNDGKLRIFWSKIFRYPPINLYSHKVSALDILNFSKQFLTNQYE